ncbi:hypothetical protein [Vibrio cholerae]|uniref:hypothetical protein n=1 Tax=Vibrio phage ICP2_2013_A_Haiti TaxID=1529058 RepID=UPI0004E5E0B9|nr:hypothetical protein [Vibrio cholerae]YP_009056247.1 hypothetical protein LD36_gp35 [Vibrio phage ICP2_2013_A_Haiti]AII27149.1 hypothetical protein ICP22013AHaiti_35 [Vibrio phage ICP2_2013_A_Haiti]
MLISKTFNVFGLTVVHQIDDEKFIGTTLVDGEVLHEGELRVKTKQAALDAVETFGEDHAKGAAMLYKEVKFFGQPMVCKKSYDCLGGMMNVAMVAPCESSRDVGCVVSKRDEDGDWEVVHHEMLALADESSVTEMLRLYTQNSAEHLAVSLMLTGSLGFSERS